jgi:hypothetical protein
MNETRRVGRQAGDDGAVPSRVEIQCECVHLYERSFPEEPDTHARSRRESRGYRVRHKRRIRRWQGQSAVLPDDSDMHLGRERPPPDRPETGSGGWQRGSLTPQMPPSPLLTAAPTATRAAKSAARLTVVKLLIAKNIATSPTDAITFLSRLVDQRTAHKQGGTTAPESVFPPPFLRFRLFWQSPGERDLASRDLS